MRGDAEAAPSEVLSVISGAGRASPTHVQNPTGQPGVRVTRRGNDLYAEINSPTREPGETGRLGSALLHQRRSVRGNADIEAFARDALAHHQRMFTDRETPSWGGPAKEAGVSAGRRAFSRAMAQGATHPEALQRALSSGGKALYHGMSGFGQSLGNAAVNEAKAWGRSTLHAARNPRYFATETWNAATRPIQHLVTHPLEAVSQGARQHGRVGMTMLGLGAAQDAMKTHDDEGRERGLAERALGGLGGAATSLAVSGAPSHGNRLVSLLAGAGANTLGRSMFSGAGRAIDHAMGHRPQDPQLQPGRVPAQLLG